MANFLSNLGHVLAGVGKQAVQNLEQGPPQYQIDEQGNTVSVNAGGNGGTPPFVGNGAPAHAPGQLFKNLLAGALTGLASGQPQQNPDGTYATPSFGGSFMQGMTGVQNQAAARDLAARKQAQQDFENRNKAQEASDKHNESVAEVDFKKAQIGKVNLDKLKVQQEIEGNKFTNFEKQGQHGKSVLDSQIKAGGQVHYEDLTFDEAHQALANDHSLTSRATFQQTGVKSVQNPDGSTSIVPTYSIYTPADKIQIGDSDIKRYKDAGMVLPKGIKGGLEVSGLQKERWENEYNQKSTAKLALDKQKAEIEQARASAANSYASAEQHKAETAKTKKETEQLGNGKPATPAELQAYGFYGRANDAMTNITGVEDKLEKMDMASRLLAMSSPNFSQSEDGQKYNQAKRQFIEAYLRYDSGANIPTNEYNQADQTLFIQPGDKKAVIQQKKEARKKYLDALAVGSGNALKQTPAQPKTDTNGQGTKPPGW